MNEVNRRDAMTRGAALAVAGVTAATLGLPMMTAEAAGDAELLALAHEIEVASAAENEWCRVCDAIELAADVEIGPKPMDTTMTAYEKARAEAYRRRGGETAEEIAGRCGDRRYDAQCAALEIPAATFAGLLVKARIMTQHELLEEMAMESLLADLERLAAPANA